MKLSRAQRLRRTVRWLFWTPVTVAVFAWAGWELITYPV